ncbi:MAG: DUF4124 domain-containing protein [Methylovulum sp.]|nr:DUF4124 domain-containing protein [Methylovulum sp.]
MNKKITKLSVGLIIAALNVAEVAAGVYKWVDEQGIVHFSSKPPADERVAVDVQKKQAGQHEAHPQQMPEDENGLTGVDAAFAANDYIKALALLTPLAEHGNPRAQNDLGVMYSLGLGVPKDLREGFYWRQKAADQGYGLAQYYLGLMYVNGQGVPRDSAEGMKWLRKAAGQNISDARFSLGEMYAKGEGVGKDSRQAAEWYHKAAEQGHAFAQHNLAQMYASGEGVRQDRIDAFLWEQRAASQGDRYAQYGLGLLYAKGEGVKRDYNAAFNWIRKAAEQDYPLSFDFGSGWKMGYYAESNAHYGIAEYIPKEDNINTWKERLTIQHFPPLWGVSSPEKTFDKLKVAKENECPGLTTWHVLGKDENSLLYEWQSQSCLNWPEQHEIAKIIYGKDNTFILHYTVKTYQMRAGQRAKWVKLFLDAK